MPLTLRFQLAHVLASFGHVAPIDDDARNVRMAEAVRGDNFEVAGSPVFDNHAPLVAHRRSGNASQREKASCDATRVVGVDVAKGPRPETLLQRDTKEGKGHGI